MGAAYFIVLERDIDGFDASMCGKNLSRQIDSLDEAARKLSVRPLSEFVSIDPGQAAEFMEDEGMDTAEIKLPPLKQYSAQEGLATVRALITTAEAQPAIEDLKECERILSVAAAHSVGWHFEVDF